MRPIAHPPTGGLYRPRNPRACLLYQCVGRHRDELATTGLIVRKVATEVPERFLDCGTHYLLPCTMSTVSPRHRLR